MIQFPTRKNSRGFTLVEILVTIAIVAVLAGVLLPALFNQLSRGDTGRLASDMNSLRTGVETFGTDTHRLPKSIDQLISATAVSSGATDINGETFGASIAARWRGPYVNRDIVGATGGGTFQNSFVKNVAGDNGGTYLSAIVSGLTAKAFGEIDKIFDEGVTSGTPSTTGVVRYTVSGTATSTTFLIVPIQ